MQLRSFVRYQIIVQVNDKRIIMNSWTIVLVAAVVICCGVVQCDKDAFMAVVKDCAKENNVSDEQMKEMKEKSKSPDFVPSEAGKVTRTD